MLGWALVRSYLLTLPAALVFTARHWPEIVVLRATHGIASPGWVLGIYGLVDVVDAALFAVTALVALVITFRNRLPMARLLGREVV